MKTRNGLVSNSSASSFIVAVPKGESSKTKLTIEIDFKDLSSYTINTEKELEKYFCEEYGYTNLKQMKDEKYLIDLYKQGVKSIKSGQYLLCGEVVKRFGSIESFIFDNGIKLPKNSTIQIIENPGESK